MQRARENRDHTTYALLAAFVETRDKLFELQAKIEKSDAERAAQAVAARERIPGVTVEQVQEALTGFGLRALREAVWASRFVTIGVVLVAVAVTWAVRDRIMYDRVAVVGHGIALELELPAAKRWLDLMKANPDGLLLLREIADPKSGRAVQDWRGWKRPPPTPTP